MLCVDVAPADGASIQQTLKLLEEKLKSVGKQNISAFHLCTIMNTLFKTRQQGKGR